MRIQILLDEYKEFADTSWRKHVKTEYLEDGSILVTQDIVIENQSNIRLMMQPNMRRLD